MAATPLLAYPLWYLFAGPEHISGTPSPRGAYPIGPLDTLLPNGRGVLAGLLPWRLPATGFLTDVGFVGFPLLVVAIVIVVRRRHDPLVVTAGLLGALAGVLMLGPSLQLGVVDLPMPFMVLAHLPLVGAMIPNRLALYVYLALGVLVAAGADRLWHRARTGVAAAKGQVLGAGAVLLASVALIAPSSAVPVAGIGDAQAFANGRLLERGAVVLAYPYPAYGHDEAMLWQATGGMRFELLGGYAEHPIGGAMVNGHPVALPPGTSRDAPTKAAAPIDPAALSDLFFDQVGRGSAGVIAAATRQLRPFVERNAVTAIAVDTGAANGRRVARVVTGVFGQPRRVGPLRLWSHLRGR